MSQVLSGEQSLDPPSRYTVFEREVFGASSPQSDNFPKTSKKQKRFSEVAFAGESPNLQDVTSGLLTKSKKTVLVLSSDKENGQSFMQKSVELFDSSSGSSTVSLDAPAKVRDAPKSRENVSERQTSIPGLSPKATQDPTFDLLTTESFIESSAVINGQPNVLRIECTPDPVLAVGRRLSREQQVELSVQKAREWVNSIPDRSDPVPDVPPIGEHDNSLVSTISRISPTPRDSSQRSILYVEPDPNVKEVRILLQRLDPQLLLRVPIRDIEKLINNSSNLSLPQVQKTMNNLLTSNKIGLTPVDKCVVRSIQFGTRSKKTDEQTLTSTSPSVVHKKLRDRTSRTRSPSKEERKGKKRKLFNVVRQSSNISQQLNVSEAAENVHLHCPYIPPPAKKRGRPQKKNNAPVGKKLPGSTRTKPQKKAPLPQKPMQPLGRQSPLNEQQVVVRKTRSSDLLKSQTTPKVIHNKPTPGKIPSSSNTLKKNHEMTLRKKSTSRRTSLFFQPKRQVSKPKKVPGRSSSASKKIGPRVVCTFLHREEVDTVASGIKKLGGIIESKVTSATTHVVCGGPKRTINLLRGIARGCWLVTLNWVLQSLEKRQWIDEEPFEVTNFSPAVQKCRIARETLGLYPTIFEKVGTVYVAPKTAPPKSELCELLKLCGAKIVTTTRRASVAVGAHIRGVVCVSEIWVLDSIQENTLLPFQRYLLEKRD